jgi:glycosyltransferase involved in cell wall biosynthesis
MVFYDPEIFGAQYEYRIVQKRYIAIPTVSITEKHRKMIHDLICDGIDVIAFGPRRIESKNYLGYVTDEKLKEILTNASATLFLFDYEAFGLIPLESLICGTPVITEPKLGVYTEYNTCSDVHFAEEYEDIKALCRQFLGSDKTSDSRRRCIDWAKQYNPESVTKKILQAYENEKMRKSTLKI